MMLEGPILPMLARTDPRMPRGGDWVFEPKWDGLRAIVFHDQGGAIRIQSRDQRDLARYFPEVIEALGQALSAPCVLDGEIVLATPDGLEFDVLLQRIHPAVSRVTKLAAETPATLVAFDALAQGSEILLETPLRERRGRLLDLVGPPRDPMETATTPGPAVVATAQTGDRALAERWFEDLEDVGLDGVIAKDPEGIYVPGKRVMIKVKHRRTADCVVGGYRLHKSGDGVGSLLLGLYHDEVLHYVGFAASFKASMRAELLELVAPLEGEAFGKGRSPGGMSRWNRGEGADWVSVRPELTCEVAYDFMQGHRFRHGARFLRWRPDKAPGACTFEQLPPSQRPRFARGASGENGAR